MVVLTIVMWMDDFDTSGSVSVNAPVQVIFFQHIELSFLCFNCLFSLLDRMGFYLPCLILAAGYV